VGTSASKKVFNDGRREKEVVFWSTSLELEEVELASIVRSNGYGADFVKGQAIEPTLEFVF
jgi:ABC-type uncharacterized transport system ATPase component